MSARRPIPSVLCASIPPSANRIVLAAPASAALAVFAVARPKASSLNGAVTLQPLPPSAMNCRKACSKPPIGGSIFSYAEVLAAFFGKSRVDQRRLRMAQRVAEDSVTVSHCAASSEWNTPIRLQRSDLCITVAELSRDFGVVLAEERRRAPRRGVAIGEPVGEVRQGHPAEDRMILLDQHVARCHLGIGDDLRHPLHRRGGHARRHRAGRCRPRPRPGPGSRLRPLRRPPRGCRSARPASRTADRAPLHRSARQAGPRRRPPARR